MMFSRKFIVTGVIDRADARKFGRETDWREGRFNLVHIAHTRTWWAAHFHAWRWLRRFSWSVARIVVQNGGHNTKTSRDGSSTPSDHGEGS